MNAKIGIIGGSGLYQFPGLENKRDVVIETPFGPPSDSLVAGLVRGVEVCFLPRHGRGHKFLPSEVNYCGNIAALKKFGCTHVLSVSAVGSLKEDIRPGDMVLVDQFIDWTKGRRRSSFFGEGVVGHIPMAHPVCQETHGILAKITPTLGFRVRTSGTYVCMEGPQFSTQAERHLYRSWNADVIGMTNVPEYKLAAEAGLSYATMAMATDYDCWHPDHDAVTVEQVVKTLHDNIEKVKKALLAIIPVIAEETKFPLRGSRENAIMTAKESRPAAVMQKLEGVIH